MTEFSYDHVHLRSPDPEIMAPTVLERICRHADGWLARAAGSMDSVIADWAQIQQRLDEIGRPKGSITFGHVNFMLSCRPTTKPRHCGCSGR